MEAAKDGETVTLQEDVELSNNIWVISDSKDSADTITLDLNGKTINGGSRVIHIGADCSDSTNKKYADTTLKIVGEGNLSTDSDYASIYVDASKGSNDWNGAGTLDLSDWKGGEITFVTVKGDSNIETDGTIIGSASETAKIGKLSFTNIQHDLNVTLNGGSYGEICYVSGSSDAIDVNLMLDVSGNYAFKHSNGSFVSYDSKINSSDSLSDVSVVKCTAHYDGNSNGKCDYCALNVNSADAAVKVGGETYYFYHDSDSETTIDAAVAYANEHNNDNAVLTLMYDYLIINKANCVIDLNGKTVESLSPGVNSLVVSGSGTVEYLEAGSVSGILKGGTYKKIKTDSGTKLGDLLAEGYGFKSNGLWLTKDDLAKSGDLSTQNISNVTVTPLPITSLSLDAPQSITYGDDLEMTATVTKPDTTTSTVTYAWFYDGEKKGTSDTIKISNLAYKEGGYTFCCTATCEDYSLSKEVTVMVNKADLSNAELTINNPESLVCTPDGNGGSSLKTLNVDYGVTYGGKTLTEGTDFTVSGDVSVSKAGTYTLTVTGTGNYTGTKSLTYTVKPCTLSELNKDNGDWEKSYDGTTDISEKAPYMLTFNTRDGYGVTLTNGADYTVEAADFNDAAVGNSKSITLTIQLNNKNFTFVDGSSGDNTDKKTFSGVLTGSIEKGTISGQEKDLSITNDLAKTYTYNLKDLLPELTDPATYGAITYGTPEVSMEKTGYYTKNTAKIDENGILSLPILQFNTKNEGKIGQITVKASTANYEDMTLVLNINAKNKLVPTGTPTLSKASLTYGEALSEITLSGSMSYEGKTVTGTFTWDKPNVKPAAADAYEAAWTFTPDDNETYAKVTGTTTISVNPIDLSTAELTINNQKDLICTPDETDLKKLTVDYTVSYGGKTLVKDTDFTVPEDSKISVSKAGTYTLTVTGTGNYTGTKSVSYTVAPCTLSALTIGDGWTKTYDGTTNISEAAPDTFTFDTAGGQPVTLSKGTDYTVEAAVFDSAEVGNKKKVTIRIKLNNENFTFANNETEKSFSYDDKGSITKATATAPADGQLEVTNDLVKTYTYDLTKLLPELTDPATYGAITYGTPEVTLSEGYYTEGAEIKDGVLSLPIEQLKTATEGAIGTVSAIVKTANYKNMTLTISVSAKNKPKSTGNDSFIIGGTTTDDTAAKDTSSDSKTSAVEIPASSGSGNIAVSATVEGTTATVAVDSEQIDQLIESGKKTVSIDLSSLGDVDTVKLPADMMSQVDTVKNVKVTIKLENGAIKLDKNALKKIDTSKDVTISIQQTTLTDEMRQVAGSKGDVVAVLDVDLYVGTKKKIYFRDSKMSISIPYTPKKGEDTSKLSVCFVRKNGKIKEIKGTYNARTGTFVFKTKRLTQYLLVNTGKNR